MRPRFAHLGASPAARGLRRVRGLGRCRCGRTGLTARIERAGAELARLAAGRVNEGPRDPFADPVPFEQLLGTDRLDSRHRTVQAGAPIMGVTDLHRRCAMTRALVVYESLLGNTQAVALAIAEGLRPGRSRCARWARHRTRSP